MRALLWTSVAAIALIASIAVLMVWGTATGRRASSLDSGLARGRAQFDSENYLEALSTLRGAVDAGSRDSRAHTYLGWAYYRLHLYQAAAREFQVVMDRDGGEVDGMIGMAATSIELGDAARAVEYARKASSADPRSLDAWFVLSRAHWIQRDFAEAEKALARARGISPHQSGLDEFLLRLLFDRGQRDAFERVLSGISTPGPEVLEMATAHFLRGGQFGNAWEFHVKYHRRRAASEALRTELAIGREPESAPARVSGMVRNLLLTGRYDNVLMWAGRGAADALSMERGKAHWALGQTAEAVTAFEAASRGRVHQFSAEAALFAITGDLRHWTRAFDAERPEEDLFVLGRLDGRLARGDARSRALIWRYGAVFEPELYARAAEEGVKALEQHPGDLDLLLTVGTAYQRMNRLDDARRYFEDARRAFPRSAEPVSRLAGLAVQAQDAPGALKLMTETVAIDPTDAGALYNLGWFYDQTGERERARELYERSIRSSPLSFEAMNNLALIMAEEGQPDLGRALLERAIQIDPDSEAAHFNLAGHFARMKDWRNARSAYGRVISANPLNVPARIEQARILLDQGGHERAATVVGEALAIDSRSLEAYLLLSAIFDRMGHLVEAEAALGEAERIRPGAPEVRSARDKLKGTVQ